MVSHVKFDPKHLSQMIYVDDIPGQTISERLEHLARNPDNHIITILKDETPLAVMVGVMVWPGTMEVSALVSEAGKKHFVTTHRSTLDLLYKVVEGRKIHRAQMTVNSHFDVGMRWAKVLGFEKEATLEQYGPNREDFVLYRRLFPWR